MRPGPRFPSRASRTSEHGRRAGLLQLGVGDPVRNDNGTAGQTTSYSYTFLSGTNQIESTTVTLPAVTTAQNGSNSATTVTVVSDAFGRPVCRRIRRVHQLRGVDDLTGAVVKSITDVDTTQTGTFATCQRVEHAGGRRSAPDTTYEVDALVG